LVAIYCGLVHSAFGKVVRTMPCSKVALDWLASTSNGNVTVRWTRPDHSSRAYHVAW